MISADRAERYSQRITGIFCISEQAAPVSIIYQKLRHFGYAWNSGMRVVEDQASETPHENECGPMDDKAV